MVEEDVRFRLQAVRQYLEGNVRTGDLCRDLGTDAPAVVAAVRGGRRGRPPVRIEETGAESPPDPDPDRGPDPADAEEAPDLGGEADPRPPGPEGRGHPLADGPQRPGAERAHGPREEEAPGLPPVPAAPRGQPLADGRLRVPDRRSREGVRLHG